MLRYFLDDREVTGIDAPTAWFDRAENHGIDVPKAISICEDASEALAKTAGASSSNLAFASRFARNEATSEGPRRAPRGKPLPRVDQTFANASRA
jgi:hypothetical protein